jgi:hypothetical protein
LCSIARTGCEQIHQVIDPARRRFQLVTILSIVFEVHERIARKTPAERSKVISNLRALYSR